MSSTQGCKLPKMLGYMNLVNVKVVIKYEGCLLCLWIFMRCCFVVRNGLMLFLPGIFVCSHGTGSSWWPYFSGQGHLASSGALCSLLSCSLLGSTDWLAGGNADFPPVHSPGNLLGFRLATGGSCAFKSGTSLSCLPTVYKGDSWNVWFGREKGYPVQTATYLLAMLLVLILSQHSWKFSKTICSTFPGQFITV